MLLVAALLVVAPISTDPSDPGGSPRTAQEDRRGLDSTPLLNPWVAAGLALAPSMAASALATANPAFSQVATAIIPFSFGLGHLYAGDPRRALAITGSGPLLSLAGAGLGGLVSPGPGVGLGGMATATIFGSWAAVDAYETAERTNQRGRPGVSTTPGEAPTHLDGPRRPLGP
jgi:hypothetical protein